MSAPWHINSRQIIIAVMVELAIPWDLATYYYLMKGAGSAEHTSPQIMSGLKPLNLWSNNTFVLYTFNNSWIIPSDYVVMTIENVIVYFYALLKRLVEPGARDFFSNLGQYSPPYLLFYSSLFSSSFSLSTKFQNYY